MVEVLVGGEAEHGLAAAGEEPISDARGVETRLGVASDLFGASRQFSQIGIDLALVPEVVRNDGVDLAQIRGFLTQPTSPWPRARIPLPFRTTTLVGGCPIARRRRPVVQRVPLLALAVASPVLLVGLVVGAGRSAAWAFALTAMLLPPALIALAAGRRALGVAAALAVLLAGGAALMLGLAGGERIGGLPGSAWAMFGALWAGPLVLTVGAYAAGFRRRGGGAE